MSAFTPWLTNNSNNILEAAWTAMDQTYGATAGGQGLQWIDNTGNGANPAWMTPQGWKVVTSVQGGYNGKFVIYQNTTTQPPQVMVVAMGTNGNADLKGWYSNASSFGENQWASVVTQQKVFSAVNTVLEKMGVPAANARLIIAGDSKGGALAQFITATYLELKNAPMSEESVAVGFHKFKFLEAIKPGNVGLIARVAPGVEYQMGEADYAEANLLFQEYGVQAIYSAPQYQSSDGKYRFEAVSRLGGGYLGGDGHFFIDSNPGINPESLRGHKFNGGAGPISTLSYLHRLAYSDWDAAMYLGGGGNTVETLLAENSLQIDKESSAIELSALRTLGSGLRSSGLAPAKLVQIATDAITSLLNANFDEFKHIADLISLRGLSLPGVGANLALLVMRTLAKTVVVASGGSETDLTGPTLNNSIAKLFNATKGDPAHGEVFDATGTDTGIVFTGTQGTVISVVYQDDETTKITIGNQKYEFVANAAGTELVSYKLDGGDIQASADVASDESSVSTVTYAGGGYAKTIDDGQGNVMTDYFTQTGQQYASNWIHADGTSGVDQKFATGLTHVPGGKSGDLTFFETVLNPDGTYSVVRVSPEGTMTTTKFDAHGTSNGQTTQPHFGGSTDYDRDNNTATVVQDPNTQNGLTQYRDAAGHITHETYTALNGDQVVNTYYPSAAFEQSTTHTDGSEDVYNQYRSTDNRFDVTTQHLNAEGDLTSDEWTLSDGATGHDTFTSEGAGTGTFTHANGRDSTITLSSNGDIVADNTDGDGNGTKDEWKAADGSQKVSEFEDGGLARAWFFAADGTVVVDEYADDGSVATETKLNAGELMNPDGNGFARIDNDDGSFDVYFHDSNGDALAFEFDEDGALQGVDHVGATGKIEGGYGGTLASGAAWTGSYNMYTPAFAAADGTEYIQYLDTSGRMTAQDWERPDGSHGVDTFNEDGSRSGDSYSADGSSIYYQLDAQGDSTQWFYDAGGDETREQWLDSDGSHGYTVFNDDGSWSSASYDLDGTYSIYADDGQGATSSTEYDADGAVQYKRWDNADGTGGDILYAAGGASGGDCFNANGSWATWHIDVAGNQITTDYSFAGAALDDSWTHVDGSHGSDTFNPDGSSAGTAIAVAGSYSLYTNNGTGQVTTTNYDAAGTAHGSTIAITDSRGTVTTSSYTGPGGTGTKTADTWTTTAGGHGSDTFNADGSSFGTAYNVDGSYSTYTDDGAGNRQQDNFNAAGVKTGDSWTHADGTWGNDVFYANGTSSGTIHHPDGTYTLITSDASGHVDQTTLSTAGAVVGVSMGSSDDGVTYPNTSTVTYSDGSYRVTVQDAPGASTSKLYSASGIKLNDTWSKADGSHGVDNFYSNGARDGSTYHADGSLDVYRYDGVSQTRTTSFDANSTMTGQTVTESNGLDSITSYLNPLGVKLSETYVRADGSTGVDLVSANDFNGFANLEQQAHLAGAGRWGVDEGPGGRSSWDGIDDGYSWWWLDWSPTNHVEIGTHYDAAGSVDLSIDQGWYHATFADPDSHVGYIELDVGWEPGVRLGVDHGAESWDYYIDISGVAGTVLEGYKAGTTTLGSPPNEPTPWSDGLGNLLLKNDRADVWFHNDGTFGVDWYAADGSIARGYSIEPNGKYVVFSKDIDGNVVSTVYPGSQPHTNFPATPPAPPVQITPLPRPPIDAAPSGGTGSIYSHPYTNGDYTADITRQANSQTGQSVCDQVRTVINADGSVQSKTVVHTDPGYDVAVAVADGFTGWTYDDAGRVTARYFDDGHGSITTYQYDLLGNISGKTVAVTNVDGSVGTTLYDAGGALSGFTVKTFPAFAEIDIANLDAAGRATGTSREFQDGRGNSIVSQYDASGNLLGSTASVVDETGDTTTVTSYDASGNATKIIVTTGDSSGAVQTYNYDGSGHLMGSVIATPDSTGNIHTVNYNAAGAITSYVEIVTGAGGESIVTTYDAHSVRVREDVLDANGVHTSTEFKADGSSVATQMLVDGSRTVFEKDGGGGEMTTAYASDGAKVSLTWAKPDGSYGSETFSTDGSSTGVQHDADGGHEDIVTSSAGEKTTTFFDAAGIKTGSAVLNHTGSQTEVTTYDPSGAAIGEHWWRADGSFGSVDWSDSALIYSESHLADGTYSTGLDDRHGDVTTTYFDLGGASVGDAWTRADGSHGVTTFNADGTLSGSRVDASGGAVSFDNAAPGISADQAIATQNTIIGRAWTFKVPDTAFAEADWGDMLTYSATLADGSALPSWLAFNSQTHTFIGTPPAGAGNLNIQVTARNMESSDASAAFTLAITPDHAPTVTQPISAPVATEDSLWTFAIPASTFSDADAGDVLAYSARIAGHAQLPTWLSFNAATGTFTGTPLNGNVGTTTIQVTATDISGLAVSANFDLTVLNANDAPKVSIPIGSQNATENSPWTFVVPLGTFSDVDVGDTLTYAATTQSGAALPSWLTFNAATRTFSGTPPYVASGSLSLKVTATDSAGASAYSLFSLAVTNTDHPPVVAHSIANQTATEDSPWSFVVPTSTFSDPDAGDTLTYSARVAGTQNLQAWMTFNAATHTFSGTPTNGFVGVKTIQVTATDASGASVSTNFDVTVLNTNDAPKVATTIGSQTTPEDSPWTFAVPTSTFTDVDVGDVLSYSAKLGNGSALPSWLTFNAGTHTFSGTPIDPGTLTLKVIATDLAGASASTNFSLVVTAAGTSEIQPMTTDVPSAASEEHVSIIGIAEPVPHLIDF